MHLSLTQTTIATQTYWLGQTANGLAFVGRANGPKDEWRDFFPAATATVEPNANQAAQAVLRDFLTGKTLRFDAPLDDTVGTAFQRQVWAILRTIPYGQQVSYQQVALQLNRPTAVRAVAHAIARNPCLIATPCHRVVRQDGTLGGYRGGLPMKRALLALEARTIKTRTSLPE
ncbi:methylated-DNA--[protein]-cysteine S-methyltransferase [Lactiplantibacillus modestisalitolerans]|uniref:Methylated-DNA--[protein]-cysteine S-methyltransferase n=1 Tax=Lactiplantibacillus modestisalitolerans TaxID=1457219 RepID=A0ABV5WSA7_9LACO|nr:methylated-DNA--[protein]-cysteine S-methyltransferase [Lactiplantibacillus modestisalitolerans]